MCSHGFTFGIFGLRQKVACMYIFWIQSHLHPSYKRENKIRSLSHTKDHDLYFIHITFQSMLMSTLFYSLTIPSPFSHDKKPASLVFSPATLLCYECVHFRYHGWSWVPPGVTSIVSWVWVEGNPLKTKNTTPLCFLQHIHSFVAQDPVQYMCGPFENLLVTWLPVFFPGTTKEYAAMLWVYSCYFKYSYKLYKKRCFVQRE